MFFLTVLTLSGCASNDLEAKAKSNDSSQSIWILMDSDGDEKERLDENDTDVNKVIELIRHHIECVDNRSFDNLNLDEEWETYTIEFQEQLRDSGYRESLNSLYEQNALAIASTLVYWNQGEFGFDRTTCKVSIDSVFQFVNGTEDYLETLGVEENADYTESRVYYCTKDNNEWKISNIEKSVLYKS